MMHLIWKCIIFIIVIATGLLFFSVSDTHVQHLLLKNVLIKIKFQPALSQITDIKQSRLFYDNKEPDTFPT